MINLPTYITIPAISANDNFIYLVSLSQSIDMTHTWGFHLSIFKEILVKLKTALVIVYPNDIFDTRNLSTTSISVCGCQIPFKYHYYDTTAATYLTKPYSRRPAAPPVPRLRPPVLPPRLSER